MIGGSTVSRGVRFALGLIAICWGTLTASTGAVLAKEPIRVAVYDGDGVGRSVDELLSALSTDVDSEIDVERITAVQIRAGALSQFDVLVHPGGSGSKQGRSLETKGRDAVVRFVREGGGYLGVCAGAYLATNDYDWSLNLIDAKVVDRAHWARGKGKVQVSLSPDARVLFGRSDDRMEIYYGQGPLLGRREWRDSSLPQYQSLATYDSEVAKNGSPRGIMKGTSAIVRAPFGSGRVFCFSPHPEMTEGLSHLIPLSVRWLAGALDDRATEIDGVSRIVRLRHPEGSPGGIAVLVTRKGEVVHAMGYGTVRGQLMSTTTRLSLASITKQFAAMCAAMLIEEGRLDPEEEVSHYLTDLAIPINGRAIRIKDLLYHTSGLPNFVGTKEQDSLDAFKKDRGLRYLTNSTHAQWLATMQPSGPPGKEFSYTNSGYVLLVRVIEVITGEPFDRFQKRRLFDVLEMGETSDSTRFNGSGNLRTTLLDYAKWDRAIWNQDPRLLSTKGYSELFTRGVLDSGKPVDYGYGWRLKFEGDRLQWAEHGGVGSGKTAARNLVRRYLDDGVTIAVFVQEDSGFNRSRRESLVSEIAEFLSVAP